MNKKIVKEKNHKNSIIIASSISIIIILLIVFNIKNNADKNVIADAPTTFGGDLTIVKSDITDQMKIYPYESNDTYMEIMSIRASDGTVRTALNTCQNCYSSGRGYYTQEGSVLMCQNCGNQFEVDQIGIAKDGCNPVSVVDDIETDDDEKIVINGESLVQYEPLFEKWKK